MRQRLQTFKDSLASWTVRHAEDKNAKWWLFGLSFAEASFFPVPPDVLLVAILATKERLRSYFYAAVTTVGSVFGAMLGYAIGYFLFQTVGERVVHFYHLEAEMITVQKLFADNEFFAIFVSAFTPIPYKVFTIAAGLFNINFPIFIIASLVGRGSRFLIVATAMRYFGQNVRHVFYRYFNIISLILVAIIGAVVYLFLAS